MKLFLSSLGVSSDLEPAFHNLIGLRRSELRLVHIENAADPLPAERHSFLDARRAELSRLCGDYALIDLRDFIGAPDRLRSRLEDCDVIWVGGGNVFYLRHLFLEAGFDQIIRPLVGRGVVYGGGSAGAIIAGPTLTGYDVVDDPNLAPYLIHEGLGLVDFAPIPHWGHPTLQTALDGIRAGLEAGGAKAVPIRDGRAIIVEGPYHRSVP